MNTLRATVVVVVLIGLALTGFVEYGTVRAADAERSFGLFAYQAAPWIVLGILGMLSPFAGMLVYAGFVMLALEAYAYYAVFIAAGDGSAAYIYLYKPMVGIGIVAVGALAGFLVARARHPLDRR
jgi:hypothetical protein